MSLIGRGKVMNDYLENLGRADNYKAKYEALVKAVDDAPAVDAVEVVRCKDCLHWIDGVCGNFSNEDGSDYFTLGHGYCYAGEKEDDE